MTNDGDFPMLFITFSCFLLDNVFVLVFLLFFTDLSKMYPPICHTTTLKGVHLYCLHSYCQFTTEIIASPIAAYFSQFLPYFAYLICVFLPMAYLNK
jgi:hypothetical protein